MPIKPSVGKPGGQRSNIDKNIKNILEQMKEGGLKLPSAVIKELLQNADDSEATEVTVILDERIPHENIAQEYRILCGPALLVRNNKPFQLKTDNPDDDKDDFEAICEVASGIKSSQVTAAGRFGIGFNSVYFITDTPVIFSRRRVEIFDPLDQIFEEGWTFSLDDFPRSNNIQTNYVEDKEKKALKEILSWTLPKSAIGYAAFDEIAGRIDKNYGDYKQTLFRFPLRQTPEGDKTMGDRRFTSREERIDMLKEMSEQTARSMVFLKYIKSVSFGIIDTGQKHVEELSRIDLDTNQDEQHKFIEFLDSLKKLGEKKYFIINDKTIKNIKDNFNTNELEHIKSFKDQPLSKEILSDNLSMADFTNEDIKLIVKYCKEKIESCGPDEGLLCKGNRTIKWKPLITADTEIVNKTDKTEIIWSFHIRHQARFDDKEMASLRDKLNLEQEKAIPWGAIAIPLNYETMNFGNTEKKPFWRVFLPLLEEGPSTCIFQGAFFVGPSRRNLEFDADGKDEAIRKTKWNKYIVEKILVPLLREISLDILSPDLGMEETFIKDYPEDYLSFFPLKGTDDPQLLSEYFQKNFSEKEWYLRLQDIWSESFDLLIGDSENPINQLDIIPKEFYHYADRFEHLTKTNRRFISFKLGEALKKHLPNKDDISINREVSFDILQNILLYEKPPEIKELSDILNRLLKKKEFITDDDLQGLWSLKSAKTQNLIRFDKNTLYIIRENNLENNLYKTIQDLGLEFDKVEWVEPDIGLTLLIKRNKIANFSNILKESDEIAVLEILKHVKGDKLHDKIINSKVIIPLIDILCKIEPYIYPKNPEELRLGFLIRTVQNKVNKRYLGIILLKTEKPSEEEEVLWESLFRHIFPEVHHEFSRELYRLYNHHNGILNMMNDSDCKVILANKDNSFRMLHYVRFNNPEIYRECSEKLNNYAKSSNPKYKGYADRLSASIIKYAYENWEENFDESQKITTLMLPIHKKSEDGSLIPLIDKEDFNIEMLRKEYKIQSDDEVKAPIKLPDFTLLHANNIIYHFYRSIGIEVYGKPYILKEILTRIGNSDDKLNKEMLDYIDNHYSEIVRKLENTVNEDFHYHNDLQEIKILFKKSRIVLCTDGIWRTVEECYEAWDLSEKLQINQKWEYKQLTYLLKEVFTHNYIATLKPEIKKILSHLPDVRLRKLELSDIFIGAIKSESTDLAFKDRARLILDNIKYHLDYPADRASIVGEELLPSLDGERPLEKLQIFKLEEINLPMEILKKFIPEAADLIKIEEKLEQPQENIIKLFILLKVPLFKLEDFHKRIIEKFPNNWETLNHKEKLFLLKYIGHNKLASELISNVSSLKVILTGKKKTEWVLPENVISPEWINTNPPFLQEIQIPNTEGIENEIEPVWNKWCNLKSLNHVVKEVVKNASMEQREDKKIENGKKLYAWLDNIVVTKKKNEQEIAEILNNLPWVLGQKNYLLKFMKSSEIIYHEGAEILKKNFWVPAIELPEIVRSSDNFKFLTLSHSATENIKLIADCLANSLQADIQPCISIYNTIVTFIRLDGIYENKWENITQNLNVYHLFRKPEKIVPASQLFIGNQEFSEDFSDLLFCLKANKDLPAEIPDLYKKSGVNSIPSVKQIITSLSNINDYEADFKPFYNKLVETFLLLSKSQESIIVSQRDTLDNVCVLNCSGIYKSVSECYWDREIGSKDFIEEKSFSLIIDNKDKITKNLINWFENKIPDVIKYLQKETKKINLLNEPKEINSPDISLFIEPWKDLLSQLSRKESTLHYATKEIYSNFNMNTIQLIPVEKIRIQFILEDGQMVTPSEKWEGPKVFYNNCKLFIRINQKDNITDSRTIEAFDEEIAKELNNLLCNNEAFKKLLLENLERPSVVLKKLHNKKLYLIFHQYQDQAGDPDFTELFDKYQHTSDKEEKTRRDLEIKMNQIIKEKFVSMRAEQIRNHGYDEFSIFAELIQNAEDAYIQRDILKMDPLKASITFTYKLFENSKKCLVVEHYGRPFNYWRHGSHEDIALKRDIEGVIKSAGSFKPHIKETSNQEKTIGRFGLGFKSVFLITDCPKIHSGQWHFEIKDGCVPEEIPLSSGLLNGITRIELPLRELTQEIEDNTDKELSKLLPFLRKIIYLELNNSSGRNINIQTDVEKIYEFNNNTISVELVKISGLNHLENKEVRFLRCRHKAHQGQIGLYIDSNNMPGPWADVFTSDIYVALPLKVNLYCGIAVSHLFEVQSGRIHLINLENNQKKFKEITELIKNLIYALIQYGQSLNLLNEIIIRFWLLWKWDIGDKESSELRKLIAKELLNIAEKENIIPTLNPDKLISSNNLPIFYFKDIPNKIRNIIIKEKIKINSTKLIPDNVVTQEFAHAFLKIYEFLDEKGILTCITIEDLARVFQDSPWLAERPDVLSEIASHYSNIAPERIPYWYWLSNCLLLAEDINGNENKAYIKDLLPWNFPGSDTLPTRFFQILSKKYHPEVITFLTNLGLLKNKPEFEQLKSWVECYKLTQKECLGILLYLSEEERWLSYYNLAEVLNKPWFPNNNNQLLTTREAYYEGLISEENRKQFNDNFKSWLAILTSNNTYLEFPVNDTSSTKIIPSEILMKIYNWWEDRKTTKIKNYEFQFYPDGKSPDLTDFDKNDTNCRIQWMTLLIRACMYTMGRTTDEQHRNFIKTCKERGWLNTFASSKINSDEWIEIIRDYHDNHTLNETFYEWMKYFISIFKLANWLEHYVESFLAIDKISRPIPINLITDPRSNPAFQGGGPSAPPITKTLGMGACFVIRELTRLKILNKPYSYTHCYVPTKRLRIFLSELGCEGLKGNPPSKAQLSGKIYEFLKKHLGEDKATFNFTFDLPLLTAIDDGLPEEKEEKIYSKLLGREINFQAEEDDYL